MSILVSIKIESFKTKASETTLLFPLAKNQDTFREHRKK